jgi:uncharacterized protein (TIGR00159 family)
MRVIAGIALLWVFQRIAVILGLIVTSWVIQGIIAAAALIIVIVFRNEIRNILQAKNFKAILWGSPYKNSRTPIQILIESVYELAKKNIGALMILPGTEDLEDIVAGGITWNGKISKEMLVSIFWPGNPVHDGAAIVADRRIQRVGTILPLSERDDLPSYFGTRHRAAVGLSERSDALAIVISEERGKVMVAKDGLVFHIKDNLELEQRLSEHLGAALAQTGWFLREKLEFSLAAFLCIVCVTGVWFSFARGLETLISLSVPVEYMNRSSQMEIMDTSVNSVDLILAGSGALVKSLTGEHVKVKIDLAEAVAGRNTYTLTRENIVLPPGIVLKEIDPAVINVVLDMPVEKVFPIQVDWVGKLSNNLVMDMVTVEPEVVTLLGGQQSIKSIDTIYTEKISLDHIKAGGQLAVNLVLYPNGLKFVDDQKEKVIVHYSIIPRKSN